MRGERSNYPRSVLSETALLPEPKTLPELHPTYRPAILANQAFEQAARETGLSADVEIALEQADGSVFHHRTVIFPADHGLAGNNFRHVERNVKCLPWQRGGWKIHLSGADDLVPRLQEYYRTNTFGQFDNTVIGVKNNGHPIEVTDCAELPAKHSEARLIGRNLNGCRIGFDLGGSDRKAAAVIDGEVYAVGEPIEVEFWAFDRGERDLRDVNMTLWKLQGPVGGEIAFESLVELPPPPERAAAAGGGRGGQPGAAGGRGGRGGGRGFGRGRGAPQEPGPVNIGQSVRLPTEGDDANMGSFRATFDTPGEYVIRIRIDNFTSGDSGPGNQCCWSNGYVRVRVVE